MEYRTIEGAKDLESYCRELRSSEWIAFDTEFVSEYSYVPVLCLIQVATPAGLAVIDTLRLPSVQPFWDVLVEGGHETIVHAGREELRFCQRATQTTPRRWFDVQVASGFVTTEFPSSYHRLVQRWLGKAISKGETRTDWRQRPLTSSQLEYAVGDVRHLAGLRDAIQTELMHAGRETWFREEGDALLQKSVREALDVTRKIPGSAGLSPRALAVAKHLWRWREGVAQTRNCSPRRIVRDDLLIEIAKRGHTDERKVMAVRGMRPELKRHLPEIVACIQQASEDDVEPEATPRRVEHSTEVELIGQLLYVFVAMQCRQQSISAMLVSTAQEVRDFVAHRLYPEQFPAPALAYGWRQTVIGGDLDDLLAGRAALRVADPTSAAPLRVEPYDGHSSPTRSVGHV